MDNQLYPLLSRNEAAAFLGLHPGTLCVWASTGRHALPFIKVGRRAMYRREDLDKWLNARVVHGNPPSEESND